MWIWINIDSTYLSYGINTFPTYFHQIRVTSWNIIQFKYTFSKSFNISVYLRKTSCDNEQCAKQIHAKFCVLVQACLLAEQTCCASLKYIIYYWEDQEYTKDFGVRVTRGTSLFFLILSCYSSEIWISVGKSLLLLFLHILQHTNKPVIFLFYEFEKLGPISLFGTHIKINTQM